MNKFWALILIVFGLFVLAFAGGFLYFQMNSNTASLPKPMPEVERALNISPEITKSTAANPSISKILSPIPTKTINVAKQIELTITTPVRGSTVTSTKLKVAGSTAPNAEVYINEAEDTADSKGNFSVTISLDEGENTILISVIDPDGKVTEDEFTVNFLPG